MEAYRFRLVTRKFTMSFVRSRSASSALCFPWRENRIGAPWLHNERVQRCVSFLGIIYYENDVVLAALRDALGVFEEIRRFFFKLPSKVFKLQLRAYRYDQK